MVFSGMLSVESVEAVIKLFCVFSVSLAGYDNGAGEFVLFYSYSQFTFYINAIYIFITLHAHLHYFYS